MVNRQEKCDRVDKCDRQQALQTDYGHGGGGIQTYPPCMSPSIIGLGANATIDVKKVFLTFLYFCHAFYVFKRFKILCPWNGNR